jgi:hypothetical protein
MRTERLRLGAHFAAFGHLVQSVRVLCGVLASSQPSEKLRDSASFTGAIERRRPLRVRDPASPCRAGTHEPPQATFSHLAD